MQVVEPTKASGLVVGCCNHMSIAKKESALEKLERIAEQLVTTIEAGDIHYADPTSVSQWIEKGLLSGVRKSGIHFLLREEVEGFTPPAKRVSGFSVGAKDEDARKLLRLVSQVTTINEIAEERGVKPIAIAQWIRRGKIHCVKKGGLNLLLKEEVDAYRPRPKRRNGEGV